MLLLKKKEKPAKVVLAHTHAADLDQMNLILSADCSV